MIHFYATSLELPYSGKLSPFSLGSEPSVKVFSAKFCGHAHIIIGGRTNPRKFSPRNSRFVPKRESFPLCGITA